MASATDLDELAAVIEHAKQHDLIDTINSVGTGGRIIEPTVYVTGVRAFLRWAASIGTEKVEINDLGIRFADGKLCDGWAASVRLQEHKSEGNTEETLEVLLGLRCSSCTQRLDGSEPTTPVGDLGERIHDTCAEPMVQT